MDLSQLLTLMKTLDTEVSEYIAGIVSEEFLEESEKREALTEFLSESTVRLYSMWTRRNISQK